MGVAERSHHRGPRARALISTASILDQSAYRDEVLYDCAGVTRPRVWKYESLDLGPGRGMLGWRVTFHRIISPLRRNEARDGFILQDRRFAAAGIFMIVSALCRLVMIFSVLIVNFLVFTSQICGRHETCGLLNITLSSWPSSKDCCSATTCSKDLPIATRIRPDTGIKSSQISLHLIELLVMSWEVRSKKGVVVVKLQQSRRPGRAGVHAYRCKLLHFAHIRLLDGTFLFGCYSYSNRILILCIPSSCALVIQLES